MMNATREAKPRRRKSQSRAEWEKEIEKYRKSVLSAAEYAAAHGMCVTSVFRWSKQFPARHESAVPPKRASFLPLTLSGDLPIKVANVDVEVTLPNGRKVRVRGDVDGTQLARLVDALEGGAQ